MKFAYDTKAIRELLESDAKLRSKFGGDVVDVLKRRLADLRAATSVNDLIASNPQKTEIVENLSIEICKGYQLVFSSNHPSTPMLESGDVDWSAVSRIKILRIVSP